MSNQLTYKIVDGKLAIACDIGPNAIAAAKPSSTGKSRIVAGTGGYIRVTDTISISVTVITKA
jgi:hypothetical protein